MAMGRVVAPLVLVSLLGAGATWAQYGGPVQNPAGYAELYVQRYQEEGRLLIQMRPIFEALDWTVEWAPLSRTITATQPGYHLTMQIDNHLALVNGQQYQLDVPPRLVFGATYVPLRFVAEATDCQVDYLVTEVKVTDAEGDVLLVHLIED
ncbi:MAG: copper amine oxidase N-terminal domain-containing protein [Armatimonadetes bacterium]|nr:copper amine oxidase N-terminal domain-containing protein [Armatimonadota bacterium]